MINYFLSLNDYYVSEGKESTFSNERDNSNSENITLQVKKKVVTQMKNVCVNRPC